MPAPSDCRLFVQTKLETDFLSLFWCALPCVHLGFANHLLEKEKAGCFAIIVLQMNCYYKCYMALPHGAVGWSAVCDRGIS